MQTSQTQVFPPLPDYSERIITFIDLLGFTRDVELIDDHPGLALSIHSVLTAIANTKRQLDKEREAGSLKFDARLTHASDSLLLSYRPERGACSRAVAHAAYFGNVCVRRGHLPRGVIMIGKLTHDDAVLYGRGMNEAVAIEKTRIIEPRIAVFPRVIDIIREETAHDGKIATWKPFIRNRGSGEFVHILGREWSFVKKMAAEGDDGVRDMFSELKHMLPYATAMPRTIINASKSSGWPST